MWSLRKEVHYRGAGGRHLPSENSRCSGHEVGTQFLGQGHPTAGMGISLCDIALMTGTLDPPPRLLVVFREDRGRTYVCSRMMSTACTCQVWACGTGAVKGGGGKQEGPCDSPLELARFPQAERQPSCPVPGPLFTSSRGPPGFRVHVGALTRLAPPSGPAYSTCASAPLTQGVTAQGAWLVHLLVLIPQVIAKELLM